MATPSLRHAVLHHCDTPIDVWDGTAFQPSAIKLNFASRNNNREPTPYHFLQGDYTDPLAGLTTNVIKDITTDQVWIIIASKINGHRSAPYATIYRGIRAQYAAQIWDLNSPAVSSSGLDYSTTPVDDEIKIADTYVNLQAERTGTSSRPFSSHTMSGVRSCYIDSNIDISRSMEIRLADGRAYTIQEFEKEDPQAYFCKLSFVGAN